VNFSILNTGNILALKTKKDRHCVSLTDPPRMLVLKSGSFGKPDFFERALDHLKETISG